MDIRATKTSNVYVVIKQLSAILLPVRDVDQRKRGYIIKSLAISMPFLLFCFTDCVHLARKTASPDFPLKNGHRPNGQFICWLYQSSSPL